MVLSPMAFAKTMTVTFLISAVAGHSFSTGSWATFSVDERSVDAYIPKCAGAASPLILSLHAWGTHASLQKEVDRFPDYQGSECAVILYPQGKTRGYLFAFVGFSWNAGGCCPSANDEHTNDVSFLQNVITAALSKFATSKDVFVVGVSNGGMMANRLACADSRIRAFVSVSGPLMNGTTGDDKTETFDCNRSVPMLHFHGLGDPVVPYGGCSMTSGGKDCEALEKMSYGRIAPMPAVADYIAAWRSRNGLGLDGNGAITFLNGTATCTSWGQTSSNVTLCTLQNEGHAWPGICNWMNIGTMLKCTLDVDASAQSLEFFRHYRSHHSSTSVLV